MSKINFAVPIAMIKAIIFSMVVNAASAVFLRADPAAESYFPLDTGLSWEYRTYTENKKINFVMKVKMLEPVLKNEQKLYVMEQSDKRGVMRTYLTINQAGVFVNKTGLIKKIVGASMPEVAATHNPPIPIFIFPDEALKSFVWEGEIKVAFVNKKIKMRVDMLGNEKITVPAGEFECFKLCFTQLRDNEEVKEYAWYAAGIGQVKYQGGKYTKELIKF